MNQPQRCKRASVSCCPARHTLGARVHHDNDAFATPSTQLYKERDGKLCWGPLWDVELTYPNRVWPEKYESLNNTTPMKWLDRMRAHDTDYQEKLRATWDELDTIVGGIVGEGDVLSLHE